MCLYKKKYRVVETDFFFFVGTSSFGYVYGWYGATELYTDCFVSTVNDTPSLIHSADDAVTELSTANIKVGSISWLVSLLLFHDSAIACASCGYPSAKIRSYEWGQKAKRRKTTGTGRMRYLKDVSRRFKNGFRWVFFFFFFELFIDVTFSVYRENTVAKKQTKTSSREGWKTCWAGLESTYKYI